MVRAKFIVIEKTERLGGYVTIKMQPVYSSDPNSENKKFWESSPNGLFEICVNTKYTTAADQFEVGKEYYFDITPATQE